MSKKENLGFNSKLVHGGGFEDSLGSAVVPIYQTSTFAFKSAAHEQAASWVKMTDISIPVLEIQPSMPLKIPSQSLKTAIAEFV